MNLRPFSADIMAAAEKESEKLHAELAASNSDYKRVYEHWKAFKEASSQWFSTAEQSYANHAFQR